MPPCICTLVSAQRVNASEQWALARLATTGRSSAPVAAVHRAYCAVARADSTATAMSAHLCLIAWKEPMGLPNCTLVLAWPTAMSSTAAAPPACSAARATAATSRVCRSTGQAAARSPTSRAGTCWKPSKACLRVLSKVGSASRASPWARPSTANRLTPPPVRAATRITSARFPSGTKSLRPVSRHPPGPRSAVSRIPSSSQRPDSSTSASVATVSPATIPGSRSLHASRSPEASSAVVASTTVEKNGPHSTARPISSRTAPSSTMPKPPPPYSSGTASPCRPSCPAISRQTSTSYPRSSAIRRRTSAAEERRSRKERTVRRSSSCSAVNAKSIGPLSLDRSKPVGRCSEVLPGHGLRDTRRPGLPLDLDRGPPHHLDAAVDIVDLHHLGDAAQPGADSHRGDEPHLIQPVVQAHAAIFDAVGLGGEQRDQRQGQVSVRDGRPERPILGPVRVD